MERYYLLDNSAPTKLAVMADTHLKAGTEQRIQNVIDQLPKDIDGLIHAGDFFTTDLYKLLTSRFQMLIGVAGNSDDAQLRGILPKIAIIECGSIKVVIAHRYAVATSIDSASVYIYGHFHRPEIIETNDSLQLNPGSPFVPRKSKPAIGVIKLNPVQNDVSAEIIAIS